jgi:REP-associated tyrosine transposase
MNGVWHVTQRATDHEFFFLVPFDYHAFLHLLELAVKRARWKLHGYCLMTNHVHLLVQTPKPTLPMGMQFLMATYVEEFNERHSRRGALVQGRYKAMLVETEAHFVECLRYFAMNPVAAGLCQRPEEWQWSSYAGDGTLAPRVEELLRAELDVALGL